MSSKALQQIWKLVSQRQKWRFHLSVLLTTTTVLSSTALMSTSAYIISFAALKPSIADIMVPVTAVRFFGIFRACSRYLERLVSHSAVFSYLSELRVSIYEAYAHQTTRQLLLLHKTNALQTLTSDIESLQDFFLRCLLPLVSSALIALISFVIFLNVNRPYAYLFLSLYLLAHLGIALLARRLSKGASQDTLIAMGRYKKTFALYSDSILEIKRNLRTKDYFLKLEEDASSYDVVHEKAVSSRLLANQIQQWLLYASVILALITAIHLHDIHLLDGTMIAVMALSIFSLYESAPAFVSLFQKIESSGHSASQITSVMTLTPETSTVSPFLKEMTPMSDLRLQDIHFAYTPKSFPQFFKDFSIRKGEKIAIVGPSGSGKSTFAAILSGLLTPDCGSCLIDGKDLSLDHWSYLSTQIAYVDQNSYFFNKGIKDNLRLGNPKASEQDLEESLHFAGLSEWISQNWYQENAFIGQNANEISGGQKQRLALARAFLKRSPFFVLDEAFAGLDAALELELLHRLLDGPQSLIWVTHRLIEMSALDTIYVVEQGHFIAKGTHETLLETCELYQKMYQTQMAIL